MPQQVDFSVRALSEQEMQTMVDWAAAEGWNPGLNDAAIFHSADPLGFLAGFLDGEPVASISAVKYGDMFGFIGFYIVKPKMRGNGFGMSLWQAAMECLDGRNIGLDGVIAQQENYRKSGFTLAYRNIRYQGKALQKSPALPCVVSLAQVPFEQVAEYDRKLFFTPRPQFLRRWTSQASSLALGYLKQGELCGYGVIRQCGAGCKIGPLFADDEAVAEALFSSLSEGAAGQDVFLDIPEPNMNAVSLVKNHAMSPVFETARMYTGPTPSIDLRKVFGVTSFELG